MLGTLTSESKISERRIQLTLDHVLHLLKNLPRGCEISKETEQRHNEIWTELDNKFRKLGGIDIYNRVDNEYDVKIQQLIHDRNARLNTSSEQRNICNTTPKVLVDTETNTISGESKSTTVTFLLSVTDIIHTRNVVNVRILYMLYIKYIIYMYIYVR